MGRWRKVTIGEFLFEREGKYKPDSEAITGLKRIDKIDFLGNFHIAQKPSKTNMILIRPGDLVISKINVSKGAMGIYSGEEDVTATIHYSSYTFDTSMIDVEYFKRFLKSSEFIRLLKEQVKGGIKTEIKPKHILPLEIELPDIQEQRKIVEHFKSIETEDAELKTELNHQQTLLKKLRQQILQEAIEGKLTADWRAAHPDVEPASELLKRIQAEKAQLIKDKKIKKQKPLPPISEDEKPFDLPEGWVWCRLCNLGNIAGGGTPSKGKPKYWNGDIPWVSPKDMKDNVISSSELKITQTGVKNSSAKLIPENSILVVGRSGILKRTLPVSINLVECTVNQDMKVIIPFIKEMTDYLQKMLWGMESYILKNLVKYGMTVHSLKYTEFSQQPFPLPPLAEQKAIVAKVEKLLALCDQLESQITRNQSHAEQLMQAVLKEAFQPARQASSPTTAQDTQPTQQAITHA